MSVSDKVYEAAVQGRKDFREALKLERQRVKELEAVIDRVGTIFSEEYGSGETEYENELNHLFEKKTIFKPEAQ